MGSRNYHHLTPHPQTPHPWTPKLFSGHITPLTATLVVTRLKSVLINLHKPDNKYYKQCNDLYHPTAHTFSNIYRFVDEHSYQIQIGSKLMPEYPVSGIAESFSQLEKTVGQDLKCHSRWYRTRKYIIGLDMERFRGQASQGLRLKAATYYLCMYN